MKKIEKVMSFKTTAGRRWNKKTVWRLESFQRFLRSTKKMGRAAYGDLKKGVLISHKPLGTERLFSLRWLFPSYRFPARSPLRNMNVVTRIGSGF